MMQRMAKANMRTNEKSRQSMSTPMCPRLPESVMCFTRCKPNTRGKNPAMPAKMPSAIASTITYFRRGACALLHPM